MIIAVEYDDQEGHPEVHRDISPKDAGILYAKYNRKGWDAQSWVVIIDTEHPDIRFAQVRYDESYD
jgi:hypothetical protein